MSKVIKKRTIVIDGFLVTINCPTAALLETRIDVTGIPRRRYMSWKERLEDLLNSISEEYKKGKRTRGKSLKAVYRTDVDEDGRKHRRRFLTPSPYPSSFSNFLKNTIRAEVYRELNRRAVVIQRTQNRKVYLLPYREAPAFMEKVEELNSKIKGLQKRIDEYEKTPAFKKVVSYLSEVNPSFKKNPPHAKLHEIYLDISPLSLHPSVYERFVAQWREKDKKELSEARKRGLMLIQRELEKKKKTIMERAIGDLQGRLAEIQRDLSEALTKRLYKRTLDKAKRGLLELKRLAESTSCHYFLDVKIDGNLKFIEALGSGDKGKIEEATKYLAEAMGVKYTDPEDVLKKSVVKLTSEGLDERSKALLEEMI